MNDGSYRFREIEQRWRDYWIENKTFKTPSKGDPTFDPDKPKYYVLDMFPYTSGSGLHMGHPKGYIASDIYSRYKRMQGFNVLHPMGFDSFGLPAEQYARLHNVHPAEVTEQNVDIFRRQFQILGMDYDWDREISTSRPNFYRWTQWIFLELFESWFSADFDWIDACGGQIKGRARPIAELVAAFESGEKALSSEDRETVGDAAAEWSEMSAAQRAAVLNNYRLAYQTEVSVNWCPALGTVLANEEVTNEGRSEVGDHAVYRRPLKQWVLRITAYADRLLKDLDSTTLPDARGNVFALEWPDPIKLMQRNWIGRSAGCEVLFDIVSPDSAAAAQQVTVFTTRPDTLFGATFMVIAPEHPLVTKGGDSFLVPDRWPGGIPLAWKGEGGPDLGIREAVAAYAAAAMGKSARQQREEREKTGIYTGLGARNPVNGQILPVFVADYVSMDYGTGAIMSVPAHDERDHEFALKYGLAIVEVVRAPKEFDGDCFTGEGTAVNSPVTGDSPFAINGSTTVEAIAHITKALAAAGKGRGAVSYKLRDWVFSRQWYWGEPFPLATHPDGYVVPTETPVILPQMDDFKPETSDDPESPVLPPLSRAGEWLNLEVEGNQLRREMNVMPQWAGSCWYFLRFIDPHNDDEFCSADLERFFMPVDLYIGGAEHAVLHLLYSRFWHKVLFDLDLVSCPEPFKRLFNQGMITADAFTDGRGAYVDVREVETRDGDPYHAKTGEKLQRFAGKMGKRFKNGLPPEEVGEEYGVDTLRLYEMYMGPLEASAPWSMEGIRGMRRFLSRIWRNLIAQDGTAKIGGEATPALLKSLHRTIAKVTADLEGLRFNTAIAALIEFNNEIVSLSSLPSQVARDFLRLLVPLAPHLAEEVWRICGFGDGNLSLQQWPVADERLLKEETVILPIQINGKVRASMEVSPDLKEDELQRQVLELENVKRHLPASAEGIKRFIVVPGKIINIVC